MNFLRTLGTSIDEAASTRSSSPELAKAEATDGEDELLGLARAAFGTPSQNGPTHCSRQPLPPLVLVHGVMGCELVDEKARRATTPRRAAPRCTMPRPARHTPDTTLLNTRHGNAGHGYGHGHGHGAHAVHGAHHGIYHGT